MNLSRTSTTKAERQTDEAAEGIHIYWSFKLKGAAILLFYTPFRRHTRKQLSSGLQLIVRIPALLGHITKAHWVRLSSVSL